MRLRVSCEGEGEMRGGESMTAIMNEDKEKGDGKDAGSWSCEGEIEGELRG